MTPLAAAAASPTSGSLSLLILGLPVLLLLWLMLTQRRRAKAVSKAQAALAVGQDVMVAAGIYGRITSLEGDIVRLQIADGVTVRVNRRSVVPPADAAGPGGGASTGQHDQTPGEHA